VLLANGLLLVLPGPLLGLSIVPLFNNPPLPWLHALYDRSIAAPVVVGVLRSLPVVTAALYLLSMSVPQSVREMARLDGHRGWQWWWKVEWPLTRMGILLAWLIGLAMTMGEHSATFAVTPPGMTTMANRIFVLIHSGARQKQASLTLIALGCFLLITVGIALLIYTSTKRKRVDP
jgi:ABC-type Fe3+ transport system permease subunit